MSDSNGVPDLIERLVADAGPVRRLPSPAWRCVFWLVLAVSMGAAISLAAGVGETWAAIVASWTSSLQIAAALLTALAAGLAAFQLSVPGRTPRWALLPLPPLLLWAAALGFGCFEDWLAMSWRALAFEVSSECIGLMVLISLPLGATAVVLIRRAAPLDMAREGVLAALAAASISSIIVQFLYPLERDFLVLMWNFGSVLALALSGGLFGSWLFRPSRPRIALYRRRAN